MKQITWKKIDSQHERIVAGLGTDAVAVAAVWTIWPSDVWARAIEKTDGTIDVLAGEGPITYNSRTYKPRPDLSGTFHSREAAEKHMVNIAELNGGLALD